MKPSTTFAIAAVVAGTLLLGVGSSASAATGVRSASTVRWQVVAGTFVHERGAARAITRLGSMGVRGFVMERDSRAGTIRFEVERPFHRTEAAHRDETTLRGDGFKPTLEREAAEDSGR